jgi:hypothetical protein
MLNKKDFLRSPEVMQFIDFLRFNYYNSAEDLKRILNEYKWPEKGKSMNFEQTYLKFSEKRIELGVTLNYREESVTFKVCSEILNWGGVGVATKNINELEKMRDQGSFMNNLREARYMIRSSIIDTAHFSIPMNSGFSKIYTLLDDHFIIYDSRVAAKMCWLVKDCFGGNPEPLKLGKCDYQAKVNRDPGPEFPMLTGRPKQYFESNIKAAWILEKLALEHNLLNYPIDKMIFAFQTALFVKGYDLGPVNSNP